MNEWMRIQMGLTAPKSAAETERAATLEGMRAEIWKAYRDSPLISACLEASRYRGLSGEDTYTLLAYHALRSLEDHYQWSMEIFNKMPVPPIMVPQKGLDHE